ncbi:helix-turn-helix domain-containing protein [Heyndrickxia sporothermodurans]|uniref:Helix-turn-helix transcriptional regulator n=1 Tax=Heyndrickxia sporothermodurans TaxID=46224 RepID=A0AB37HJW7_9BACI|nr:helix-turn-helix transcriptional regulator [Heyndrickxia sporothermodurans]MBL5768021.1 helix-turn-helix transcriptional regulator [Heyndrickxia sporothermodurans]MBL5771615.1 helix-turn-helix transcriptional regulator [Heyndrickxia sporothermodurans]MBL5785901.1 helix-turn-helix transcriptional regulator [Heyndrickxia sporothermodurans]MBL5789407.1 helix-turn-helix transcriptional regulator [Heyndrickxia sporothermodurans]MBL5796658.1 helix-turn-helix transcriptional regulator [Heyndrickxi
MENLTPKILERLRENKGWSKTTVAKKLGIKTVSTYANWEYGIRTPDKDMLAKIAEIYGVSTDYLITGEDSNKEDEEFKAFINDPELRRWYKKLPENDEEDLRKLRKMWEIIKNEENK